MLCRADGARFVRVCAGLRACGLRTRSRRCGVDAPEVVRLGQSHIIAQVRVGEALGSELACAGVSDVARRVVRMAKADGFAGERG